MEAGKRRSVTYGVTASSTAIAFLRGQLRFLHSSGYHVHLLVGSAVGIEDFARQEGVAATVVPMERNPNPRRDLLAFWRTLRALQRIEPESVVMGTPKMALIGITASWLLRVPERVYVMHGLRLEGAAGLTRLALTSIERWVCRRATSVVAVSKSLRDLALELRLCEPGKLHVLGNGSANGIDAQRFRPASWAQQRAARDELNVPSKSPVVAFVGRATADKGIKELNLAWRLVQAARPDAWLVLAGSLELDREAAHDWKSLLSGANVKWIGEVPDTALVYRAADALVLLTRREGLPTVILEAASSGIPTVATRATGTVDAVVDGATGCLVEQGDYVAAADAVIHFLNDIEQRRRFGANARKMVLDHFERAAVWANWLEFLSSGALERDLRCRRRSGLGARKRSRTQRAIRRGGAQ